MARCRPLASRAAADPDRPGDGARHRRDRDPAVPEPAVGRLRAGARRRPRRGPASPSRSSATATDAILADLVVGPPDFDVAVAGTPVLIERERAHMRDVRGVFAGSSPWPSCSRRRRAHRRRAPHGADRARDLARGPQRVRSALIVGARGRRASSASSPSTPCSRSSTRSSSRPARTRSTRRRNGSSSSSRSSSGRRRRSSSARSASCVAAVVAAVASAGRLPSRRRPSAASAERGRGGP